MWTARTRIRGNVSPTRNETKNSIRRPTGRQLADHGHCVGSASNSE